jgi:hypothetical protein
MSSEDAFVLRLRNLTAAVLMVFTFAIGVTTAAPGLAGIRLVALGGFTSAATSWCCIDALSRRHHIAPFVRWQLLWSAPFSTIGYLFATRGWRAVGWVLLSVAAALLVGGLGAALGPVGER